MELACYLLGLLLLGVIQGAKKLYEVVTNMIELFFTESKTLLNFIDLDLFHRHFKNWKNWPSFQ